MQHLTQEMTKKERYHSLQPVRMECLVSGSIGVMVLEET